MSTYSAPKEALSLTTNVMICTYQGMQWKHEKLRYKWLLKCSGLDLWYTGQVSLSRHSESIKREKIISLLGLILPMAFSRLFFKARSTLESAWSSSPLQSCCFTPHSVLKAARAENSSECEAWRCSYHFKHAQEMASLGLFF